MSRDREQCYLELIERNRGRIDRLCRSWSRSRSEGDDLRSEILLQLWRALPGFDQRSSPDTWLFRVALNTAMLHGRSRKRKSEGRETWESTSPAPAAAPTPADRLEVREQLERLHEALRRLEPADRALMMLQLEELPHREIAEIAGIGESHVGVRLHRIKKKLSRLLRGEEVDHAAR